MDDGVRCKFFRYNLSDDKSGVIDRKKWDIKTVPTLVLSVRKDGKDNKKVFFGLRDSEVMLKFIKKNIGEFKYLKVNSIKEMEEMNDSIKANYLVLFGDLTS